MTEKRTNINTEKETNMKNDVKVEKDINMKAGSASCMRDGKVIDAKNCTEAEKKASMTADKEAAKKTEIH